MSGEGLRPELAAIADMISEVLLDIKSLDAAHKVRERVRELTAKFQLNVGTVLRKDERC